MPKNELKDKSALERLVFMGLMTDERMVNADVMPVFAGIFAGLFYWDARGRYDTGAVVRILNVFSGFLELNEYHNMYLFLSIEYDRMRKPLPDPVWWLSCSPEAVEGFILCFVERLAELVDGGGKTSAEVEAQM